jgi:hypothetical protein
MNNSFESIKVTKIVYDKLKTMMQDSGFKNMSVYLEFLLEDKIAQYTAEKDGVSLTADDEEKIRKRLIELGYL